MLDYVTNFTKKPAPGPYLGFGRAHFILTKGGSGLLGLPGYNMLYSVEVATTAATGKLVIYNGTDATGDVVATIDITTKGSNKYAGLYCPAGLYVEIDTGSSTCSVSIIYDAANPKTLTVSGNEITDAIRDSAVFWSSAQSGDMVDGNTTPGGGFGIHRAATNIFTRGQGDSGSGWGLAGTAGASTSAMDATVPPPFSSGSSLKVVLDGSAAQQGVIATCPSGMAAAAGTLGAASMWFKGVAGQGYICRVDWRNTDVTQSSGLNTNFNATGAWQLLSPASVAVGVGKTGDNIDIRIVTSTARAETLWAGNAMIEVGQPVVAPYVATSGGNTATHNAAHVQAPSSVVSIAQGWMCARFRAGRDATSGDVAVMAVSDGTSNNRYSLIWTTSNGRWELANSSGGSGSFPTVTTAAFSAGDLVNVIFKWDAANVYLSMNGAAFLSQAKANTPLVLGVIEIGTLGNSRWLDGDILWFACGKGTLTDADAATINGFGNTCPKFTSFPDAALATLIWPCVTTDYLTPF